jgi:hypothetical protein
LSGWGEMLAYTWTNNVPPSRPSINELCLYRKYLDKIRETKQKPIRILILGSTPEFRDWGFEENLDITVVDKSKDYYNVISRELRHKNIKETLIVSRWEDMEFTEEFDLIVGDLSVGNIEKERVDDFINAIYNALAPGGYFLGKSFFWTENDVVLTPKQIVMNFYHNKQVHPYTFINHQLGLYCLDRERFEIDFSSMYQEMVKLKEDGDINEEIFSYFDNVGWNTDMKFTFFAPTRYFFESKIKKKLIFIGYIDSLEIYSNIFPVYVAMKEDIK